MKVLHITSDWKWTGPAAPMLELLCAQRARGYEAEIACPAPPPGADTSLREAARAADVEPVLEIARGRGAVGRRDLGDVRRLRTLLRERRFEVVHSWHTRDHVLALRAAAGLRRAGITRVVRSWSRAEARSRAAVESLAVRRGRRRPVVRLARRRREQRGAAPRTARWPEPFRRWTSTASARALRMRGRRWGSARSSGWWASWRASSRTVASICCSLPCSDSRATIRDARLLIVGRGSRIEELAARPAQRLGLGERVIFAGHRGADYADVLRSIDVFTLLVPGSDGGCRAALEAAACGIPAVTTRRGALPEIVVDGETGLLVAEDADALCAAWAACSRTRALRRDMGEAARRRAERLFSRDRVAAEVERFYRSLR